LVLTSAGRGAQSNEERCRSDRAIQARDIAESPLGRIVLQPWRTYTEFDSESGESLALAQANYEKAVEVEPAVSSFHCSLGFSYWRGAQHDRAMTSFDRAIELDPNNAKARWARVMLWAPVFSRRAPVTLRTLRIRGELARFEDWWSRAKTDGELFVGNLQPFFLSYQEEPNVALLKQYGQVCAKAMQRWLDRQKSPSFKRPMGKRIRLGIVSGDIRLHSVWMALIKGWFRSFDLERFELVVFSLADQVDPETSWARSKSDVFVGGPKTLPQWVAAMREQNCEILLYPAVGLIRWLSSWPACAWRQSRSILGVIPTPPVCRHSTTTCQQNASSPRMRRITTPSTGSPAPPRQPHTAVGAHQ